MRSILGCAVSAAKCSGVCASSFCMLKRQGCGAIRMRAVTTSA